MRLNASLLVSTALAVLALLTFDSPALGQQGTVAGTVTSQADGAGIAAVQVQVLRRDGSVVATQLTGESGAYRIPGISPATYLVSFTLYPVSTVCQVVSFSGSGSTSEPRSRIGAPNSPVFASSAATTTGTCPGSGVPAKSSAAPASPGTDGLRAQLDVQNVLDEGYQSFPGTPTIGRFTMLRLLWIP